MFHVKHRRLIPERQRGAVQLHAVETGLLAKLRAGEIDAALVYRSDAQAARLTVVPVDGLDAFENHYWAAQLEGSQAGGLLDFLRSPDGHRVFADAGLLAPTTPGARS